MTTTSQVNKTRRGAEQLACGTGHGRLFTKLDVRTAGFYVVIHHVSRQRIVDRIGRRGRSRQVCRQPGIPIRIEEADFESGGRRRSDGCRCSKRKGSFQ